MEKLPVDVWLWLLLVMQPNNRRTNFILHNCGYDAIKAAGQIRDGDLKFLSESEKRRAFEVRMGDVRKVQKLCMDNGVRIIAIDDEEYPELLRHIEDPPIVLFVAGSLEGLNDRLCISAVGTRKASEYGVMATKGICGSLAERGTAIISGLAVGLDSAAHRACLDAGGKTVGVLGCGILVNYPADSAQLKRDIVANGGAVISELLPNTKSYAGYFHIRNRIISGMSHGTIVLEAGEKSGSLLTAAHALEQGREIFCIPPHDIFSRDFAGVIPLLRDGATPVYGYDDVFNAFSLNNTGENVGEALTEKITQGAGTQKILKAPMARSAKSEKSPESAEGSRKSAESSPESPQNEGKSSQKSKKTAKKPAAKPSPKPSRKSKKEPPTSAPDPERLAQLSEDEAEIIKLLFDSPMDEDQLIDKTGKDFAEISETLTTLEIMGLIVRKMNGLYEPLLEN